MTIENEVRNSVVKHLESHKTGGKEWPADAVMAIKYNMSTWPMGWQKESSVVFFSSVEEFNAWKDGKEDWALCEDNYVAYSVYEWDLGPIHRADLSKDESHVGWTYEEKQAVIF